MRIHTTRERIRTVARRWREQYSQPSPLQRETGDRLAMLDGATATAEDVEAIIGNRTWTLLQCDECHGNVAAVVSFQPLYAEESVSVCLSCLRHAAGAVENAGRAT